MKQVTTDSATKEGKLISIYSWGAMQFISTPAQARTSLTNRVRSAGIKEVPQYDNDIQP